MVVTGSGVHHESPAQRDAVDVREGKQEEGAHSEPWHDIRRPTTTTPSFEWRLSQPRANAGAQKHVSPVVVAIFKTLTHVLRQHCIIFMSPVRVRTTCH